MTNYSLQFSCSVFKMQYEDVFHHQAQAENQFLKKKEKKPHPDPDKIIMMLSPGIVLIKTQESEEVPRWSSYITTFSTAVISRPITCKCLYNFMFHNQIKQ